MYKPDISNWFYNATTAKDRPADLGYYVGYLITQAYYRSAKDKRQAIHDILNIQDARAFYEASRASKNGGFKLRCHCLREGRLGRFTFFTQKTMSNTSQRRTDNRREPEQPKLFERPTSDKYCLARAARGIH